MTSATTPSPAGDSRATLVIGTIRWLLVFPAAAAGWYAGVCLALLIYEIKERVCPASYRVSGICHAPWSWVVTQAALVAGSCLCGALVVLLPALMAPTRKKAIAAAFYGIGLLCAGLFWVPPWGIENTAAALAGGFVLWRIWRAKPV
jgi:hypothetical protein